MLPHHFLRHAGVAGHAPSLGEALQLSLTARLDPASHVGRTFPEGGVPQFLHPQGRGLDVQVYAVEQRAAHPRAVALDLRHRATALASGIAEKAAGTWVHRGYQHEGAGQGDFSGAPRYGDFPVLQGLTQYLQGGALELRQLVEEQHAIVGQRDLPRPRDRAAAQQPDVADGVVRSPKRASIGPAFPGEALARGRVDAEDFQELV